MKELLIIANNIDIIDQELKKLFNGEVEIPYLNDYQNPSDYWYPHPPCFIPLFLGFGASYKGVIHHFFCARKDTFSEYYLEHGFFSEIARSSKQWVTLMVLKMIIAKDGMDDRIIDFCNQVNYLECLEVDEFSLDYGDDPNEFRNLVHLRENTPSRYVKDISRYDGDFPSTLSTLNHSQIQNASIFEIAVPDELVGLSNIPLWLDATLDRQALFKDYLYKNMLKEAWFTLNTKGWKLIDAAKALKDIADRTEDKLFHLVAGNWIRGWNRFGNQEGFY